MAPASAAPSDVIVVALDGPSVFLMCFTEPERSMDQGALWLAMKTAPDNYEIVSFHKTLEGPIVAIVEYAASEFSEFPPLCSLRDVRLLELMHRRTKALMIPADEGDANFF